MSALGTFLERAVRSAAGDAAGSSAFLAVDLPAPIAAPQALWCANAVQPACAWRADATASFAGLGVAHRIQASGDQRFARLLEQAGAVPRVVRRSHPESHPHPPRWFGGLAFAAGDGGEAWRPFGDATFTLPRWTYAARPTSATLTFCCQIGECAAPGLVEEWERVVSALEARPSAAPSRGAALADSPRAEWDLLVRAALDDIDGGRFDKLVVARASAVEAASAWDPVAVLGELARVPEGTVFAFREEGAVFLGRTPEQLVSLDGRAVRSEALAGSMRPGADSSLLAGAKERAEHAHVLDELLARLGPRCERLFAPSAPTVRALRDILHLSTPIRGELSRPAHVLELVEALHPSPAVGGRPVAPAPRWISAHEAMPRGWYAGPVGWFDAEGNGDFRVALRSGLLRGRRATVWAGAGIVRGSDPAAEFAETALKQRAVLSALGVAR